MESESLPPQQDDLELLQPVTQKFISTPSESQIRKLEIEIWKTLIPGRTRNLVPDFWSLSFVLLWLIVLRPERVRLFAGALYYNRG